MKTGQQVARGLTLVSLQRSPGGAQQALLRHEPTGEHFVVSHVVVPFSGPETLVFPADAEGEITDWLEIAGGRNVSPEEAAAQLAALLDGKRLLEGS